MKVFCIDESGQEWQANPVKFGQIYTVIDSEIMPCCGVKMYHIEELPFIGVHDYVCYCGTRYKNDPMGHRKKRAPRFIPIEDKVKTKEKVKQHESV